MGSQSPIWGKGEIMSFVSTRSRFEDRLVAMFNDVGITLPELDPESTDLGVHPATYGTEHYGTHRAAMPHLSDREDVPFWDIEDRMIANIDASDCDDLGDEDEFLASDDGFVTFELDNGESVDIESDGIDMVDRSLDMFPNNEFAPEDRYSAMAEEYGIGDSYDSYGYVDEDDGVMHIVVTEDDLRFASSTVSELLGMLGTKPGREASTEVKVINPVGGMRKQAVLAHGDEYGRPEFRGESWKHTTAAPAQHLRHK